MTVFLISNTIILDPYSHGTTFDPQSFAHLHRYLKFQVLLIGLPQYDIHTLWPSNR